jgi:hypothetical protein
MAEENLGSPSLNKPREKKNLSNEVKSRRRDIAKLLCCASGEEELRERS